MTSTPLIPTQADRDAKRMLWYDCYCADLSVPHRHQLGDHEENEIVFAGRVSE